MNSLLAWTTGLALVIGVTVMTNAWLGIAAGAGWAFYVRSRKTQQSTDLPSVEARAVDVKERIDRVKQSSADDPFLFWLAGGGLLMGVDRVLFDGSLKLAWDELGWRSVFTWGFWVFVGASWLLSVLLRKVFFASVMTVARMRYPGLESALSCRSVMAFGRGAP